jgi:hypothetical protein
MDFLIVQLDAELRLIVAEFLLRLSVDLSKGDLVTARLLWSGPLTAIVADVMTNLVEEE